MLSDTHPPLWPPRCNGIQNRFGSTKTPRQPFPCCLERICNKGKVRKILRHPFPVLSQPHSSPEQDPGTRSRHAKPKAPARQWFWGIPLRCTRSSIAFRQCSWAGEERTRRKMTPSHEHSPAQQSLGHKYRSVFLKQSSTTHPPIARSEPRSDNEAGSMSLHAPRKHRSSRYRPKKRMGYRSPPFLQASPLVRTCNMHQG